MPDNDEGLIFLTPRRVCHICEAFLGYDHKPECSAGGVVQYGDTDEKFTSVEHSDEYPPRDERDPGLGTGTETSEKPQLSFREKNERALGRAAHPLALDRLHEIFPEAEVQVIHGSAYGKPPEKMDEYRRKDVRFTTVSLSIPDGDVVSNTQWTYPPVQWDRKRSLARAFHCLLKDVCERTNEGERAYAMKQGVDYLARRSLSIPVEDDQ